MQARLTAQDFDQQLLILFDAYVHGSISRHTFLLRARKFATAGMSATALLAALSSDLARGQQVAPHDARLKTERAQVASPRGHGSVHGYLCRPASAARDAKLPALLVIHENRGLNPHIEDIARRLSLDGFMAFAPDALSPLGGYPGDEDKARAAFAKLDQRKTGEDFVASAQWLQAHTDCSGKLGAIGFCYGGGMVHILSTRLASLNAAVAFYGNVPDANEAASVKARLQLHFAGIDERINASWPGLQSGAASGWHAVHCASLRRHPARLQQQHHTALRPCGRQTGLGAQHGISAFDARMMLRTAFVADLSARTLSATKALR